MKQFNGHYCHNCGSEHTVCTFMDREVCQCLNCFTLFFPNKHKIKRKTMYEIENRFTYHPPKTGQPEKYHKLREEAKNLAYLLVKSCPESRELSLALTKLEEVVFWANASIARNE